MAHSNTLRPLRSAWRMLQTTKGSGHFYFTSMASERQRDLCNIWYPSSNIQEVGQHRPSQHTAKKYWECWKYKNIGNPYLKGDLMTNANIEPEDSMADAETIQNVHPISKAYGEIYLRNRLWALRRDGWRCRDCNTRTKSLVAHHVIPVPRKGKYDPEIMHRVDNLRTMCANCHGHLLLGTN